MSLPGVFDTIHHYQTYGAIPSNPPGYYPGSALGQFNYDTTRANTGILANGISLDKLNFDYLNGDDPPRVSTPVSAYGAFTAPQAELDFINADLAKYYGMSKETAYQEALSNTAYQRSVKDMVAAGLNPAVLFGSGRGSSADGVGSVRSASSGGSGGVRRRGSGSAKSEAESDLFSNSTYGALSAIGGLVGVAITKNPNSFWIGQAVAGGAMHLLNALSKG